MTVIDAMEALIDRGLARVVPCDRSGNPRRSPMSVKVIFNYEPDEPDDTDSTGMSEDEFNRISDQLSHTFGAENIQIEKQPG